MMDAAGPWVSRIAPMDQRFGGWRCAAAGLLAGASCLVLTSCGGGGISQTAFNSSAFAERCATPRPGVDQQGSFNDEKSWLRLWTNELYLWYSEVPNNDPATYATPLDYFAVLKTLQLSPSGNPKDRFHFTIPTTQWIQLSQAGVSAGYGVEWDVIAAKPPRTVRAAFTEPGSPAVAANIVRGATVITVDGADVSTGSAATLNAGLFPANPNETHTFGIQDPGTTSTRPVTMVSKNVASTPVQNVKTIGSVGYMQFNDHNAIAEPELIAAVNQLKGVTDLVLDIRYNGGGFLDIASELAFMIAGPTTTSGKTFEKLTFNDKYSTIDPVTGRPILPEPFLGTSQGFTSSPPSGQPLPSLGLSRVFVLTGPGTCSASESVINSLRGVDVNVIQIGSTTCGKPYGFYPADNCGTTYFSIQFKGVNAKGFGDYSDGFVPGGTSAAPLPGCQVADDLDHALGDPAEARLAAALGYAAGQPCPAPTFTPASSSAALTAAARTGEIVAKPPWRENRILRR
jgi:carboxyl-terminal processing protease